MGIQLKVGFSALFIIDLNNILYLILDPIAAGCEKRDTRGK